jgi:hypothetical protein
VLTGDIYDEGWVKGSIDFSIDGAITEMIMGRKGNEGYIVNRTRYGEIQRVLDGFYS